MITSPAPPTGGGPETSSPGFRHAIVEYIRREAQPPDKFAHQPRLYRLATEIGAGETYDDDVVFAAAWLHDLGVFLGHRPADPAALAGWDNVSYAAEQAPALLHRFGFPVGKIPAVVAAIRDHLPQCSPQAIEGVLVRDADILEQLGAVGIVRQVSKVGRDTRYPTAAEIVPVLRRNLELLPGSLRTARARDLAIPRVAILREFLASLEAEAHDAL